MKKAILSWTLLITCNLMWALQFTCIKLTQDQMGPYFTVWGPMLLATLFLVPFVIKDFKKQNKSLKDLLIFGQLASLGAFPAQVLMTWGTQYSLANNAAIISLALPVITTVFAFLILKENMSLTRWISFAIAIVGVLLCSTQDIKKMDFSSGYALGNLLIFIAIIGNAYYNTGCKKIAERFTEMEMVFYTYLVMILLLTPLVFYYESDVFESIPTFTSQTWAGIFLLTFFHNFLSMVLFFKALKVLDAIQVALSNYLITFFAVPIAAIWLGERLQFNAVLGGFLVLISTVLITMVDYKTKRKVQTKTTNYNL